MVIAIAVVLNFILWGEAEDTSKQLAVDLSDLSAVEGAADTAAADDGSGYFAEMALSRTQARDEAIEVLNGVINSESAVDEMKAEAQSELNRIAKDMENEANIESLVRSKGFEECVTVLNGDKATVVVKSEGLKPNQLSQILEIVYLQAGVLPANVTITEK